MSDPIDVRDGSTAIDPPDVLGRKTEVWIEVVSGSAVPRARLLAKGAVVLGAGLGADMVISDPSVSRQHARIELSEGGVEAVDLGSKNGTFCDGQRVNRILLKRDATLRLGATRVQLTLRTQDENHDDLAPLNSGGIIGQSSAMRKVARVLSRLDRTRVPVLVTGDAGTGKEMIARAIHARSPVANGPLVVVNCGALDPSNVCAVLFGRVENPTASGAQVVRQGAFEQAEGGTIVLDDVAELPMSVQSSLIRFLDAQSILRLGELEERKVDARLIAITRYNLTQQVAAGQFREDLVYRLNVIRVELPPLSARGSDLELLARYFAAEFQLDHLPDQVLARLRMYRWPGNVRELRNVLRGYAVLGELPEAEPGNSEDAGFDRLLRQALDLDRPYQEQKEQLLNTFIDVYLDELLRRTKGNQSEAARIAGLDRAHLNKMVARLKKSAKS